MNRLLAVAMASVITLGAAYAQDSGGDKVSKSNSVKTAEKSNVKAGASTSAATKGPKAQPFPTRKPADKTELNPQPLPPGAKVKTASPAEKVSLNPQPLPPGAKVKSASPAEKVALNPQPLPPGAKAADKPVQTTATVQKQRKATANATGKKGSANAEKGSNEQK